MELDDTDISRRARRRHWASIVAVVIPVMAAVGLIAWFIRAYVAPPMARIPGPVIQVSSPRPAPLEPGEPALVRANAAVPAPEPAAVATPSQQQPVETPATTDQVPMIASLAYAPPSRGFGAAPAAQTEAAPASAAEPPREEAVAAAMAVPLPRPRPRVSVAANVAASVPLPRPRPSDAAASETQPVRSFFDWLRPR
jgi:hypothetical protein